jgi:sec-independent protein translocase protein TatA
VGISDILQPTHLLFILVVALLVLGPKRLPEVGRSLGRGLRDFKDAISGMDIGRHDEVPSYTPEHTPPSEPSANDPTSYPHPESTPPNPPAAPEPVSHPSRESTQPSAPADAVVVSHPTGESAQPATDPADAELVSHPSGESAGPASEPAGHTH